MVTNIIVVVIKETLQQFATGEWNTIYHYRPATDHYSPASATDDRFIFFLLSEHLVYSLLLGCKENF